MSPRIRSKQVISTQKHTKGDCSRSCIMDAGKAYSGRESESTSGAAIQTGFAGRIHANLRCMQAKKAVISSPSPSARRMYSAPCRHFTIDLWNANESSSLTTRSSDSFLCDAWDTEIPVRS